MTLKAQMVIEIVGRPPEHIKEALNTLTIKLSSEKGIKILDKKYFDPKPIEKVKDMYSAFVQVEAEFETLNHFFSVMMGYMPSHVEIFEPEKFKLQANEINELSNFIVTKLHKIDQIAKRALFENQQMLNHIKNLQGEKPSENAVEKKPAKKKSKASSKKKK